MTQTWAVLAAVLFLMIHLIGGSAYSRVNVEAGHEAVLNCPSVSKLPLLMVTWKMKSSTSCFLAYRRDLNETRMLNCSERMMWKYSPDHDPALRIYPLNLNDEGNYTCEIVSSEGNFLFFFSLTVIVPPTLTLTSDKNGVAVCQATAGKPAAKISWIPASNHSVEKDVHHLNGTVTRVSYIGWVNSTHHNVTCLVTHPAVNQTLSLDLSYNSSRLQYLLIGLPTSLAIVIGAGVTLCLILRCRASQLRKKAHRPAVHSVTENFTCTSLHMNTPVMDHSVSPEQIYQNYKPQATFMVY
ncbi:cell surface glycoprotein CD200 receptor 1-B-like isoform X1 [Numida meleagris]|uniref:cell surface glycoprotein CD200 receptor 1-B-like isoform X1 n=1 Tax=Numida meleagris TaxID=8996 RepID=UPI000B3E04C9|nr:cell surface glycoprotein CD200 receptor 1-B-like isoform X1 [Numida meleagris]XP_021258364.1 cell surface glycoprotein CD200 receptor 1-B-like isoform X1 [Numida meleagris]XP_021258373.1 cell surface glycoprotein CD200 receptor 1-B-like isoform X1 [Numida meleagris]